MPGQPCFKSKHLDQLVDDFAVIAIQFDKLLPAAFRYDGQVPHNGTRGNCWAVADRQILLTAEALGSLQIALGLHAKEIKAKRNSEAEVVEVAKVNEQSIKTKKCMYTVLSKRVAAEQKRASVI